MVAVACFQWTGTHSEDGVVCELLYFTVVDRVYCCSIFLLHVRLYLCTVRDRIDHCGQPEDSIVVEIICQ